MIYNEENGIFNFNKLKILESVNVSGHIILAMSKVNMMAIE